MRPPALTNATWHNTIRHMAPPKKYTARPAPASVVLSPSLEYASLLGVTSTDSLDLIGRVTKGLSYSAFEHLQKLLDIPVRQLAEVVNIPARTLHRRKEEGRLQQDESDRLIRVSRIYSKALGLFSGNQAETRDWLSSPQRAFGGTSPLQMSSTDVGAREVEALIGQLEYGVFP